jgi:hypothetical protein
LNTYNSNWSEGYRSQQTYHYAFKKKYKSHYSGSD